MKLNIKLINKFSLLVRGVWNKLREKCANIVFVPNSVPVMNLDMKPFKEYIRTDNKRTVYTLVD